MEQKTLAVGRTMLRATVACQYAELGLVVIEKSAKHEKQVEWKLDRPMLVPRQRRIGTKILATSRWKSSRCKVVDIWAKTISCDLPINTDELEKSQPNKGKNNLLYLQEFHQLGRIILLLRKIEYGRKKPFMTVSF